MQKRRRVWKVWLNHVRHNKSVIVMSWILHILPPDNNFRHLMKEFFAEFKIRFEENIQCQGWLSNNMFHMRHRNIKQETECHQMTELNILWQLIYGDVYDNMICSQWKCCSYPIFYCFNRYYPKLLTHCYIFIFLFQHLLRFSKGTWDKPFYYIEQKVSLLLAL